MPTSPEAAFLVTERVPALMALLAEPFTDPASRTFWGTLLAAVVVAWIWQVRAHGWREVASAPGRTVLGTHLWTHPSSRLDLQLLTGRQLLRFLGVLPAFTGALWLATQLVRFLDANVGVPGLQLPSTAVAALYTAALCVAWDLSRYLVHRLMHEVEPLWQLHQVHHSAEVLTPLTVHRVHPLESAIYGLRGMLVTAVLAGVFFWLFRADAVQLAVLGVHGAGFLLNAATGNLRHSHVWIGFPGWLERWLISPAQHQLHHAADGVGSRRNYGTWLAIWDRAAASLATSEEGPPERFGLLDPNHGHDLLSAWLGPLRGLLSPRPVLTAALLLGVSARAGEPEEEREDADEEAADDDDLDLIITSEGGVPRAAGSAHSISEEELARFAYDDVHRVLAAVPGVNIRDEDGYGLRPNIGIRGANSDRSAKITLLEDGVLLAPAPYAAPAAYYFPMSTRLYGLEVFKGPSATRHGPQTVGGAINLLTRPTPEGGAGVLDIAAGLRSTLRVHGWGGAGGERWGVLVEAAHLSTGGFKELDTGGPTGFQRNDLMTKFRILSDPELRVRHRLQLKVGYGREVSNETYLGLSAEDYPGTPYRRYAASELALMRWYRTQAEAAWTVEVGSNLDLRTVAYHHFMSRQWTKLNGFAGGPDLHALLQRPGGGQAEVFAAILRGDEDSTSPDQTLRIGTNDRSFRNVGVQSRLHWRARSGIIASQLEVGVRLHADTVQRLHTEDPYLMSSGRLVADSEGTPATLLDARSGAVAFATHVHEDLGIGAFRVLPGLRMEHVRSTFEGTDPVSRTTLLPGLGLFGTVVPELDLFAGAHRGFSPVAPGQPQEVRPETSWSYEAGGRAHVGGFSGEAVGFIVDYLNISGQCTFSAGCTDDLIDQQFNGGKALVYGVEAVLGQRVTLPRQLSVVGEASYTWTASRFRTDFISRFPQFGNVAVGDRLPYTPEHQGSLRIAVEHPRFGAAVAATARAGMRDSAGQGAIDDTGVPPLLLLDASAYAMVAPSTRIYLTASNLTGSKALVSWRPFGARPTAPPQVMLGVTVTP